MTYFDDFKLQYNPELILKAPLHTELEIEKIISLIGNEQKFVEDFGSGNGRLTIPLLKNGYYVRAVDISNKSLNNLVKIAKQQNIDTHLTIDTELKRSPMIVGTDILHHLSLYSYLRHINKKLISGGKIVFSEPNGFNPFWYLFILLKLDWKMEKGIMEINYINLIKKLKENNFIDVKILGLGILPGPFCMKNILLCRLNYWLGNLPFIKIFAYRLIISARKN